MGPRSKCSSRRKKPLVPEQEEFDIQGLAAQHDTSQWFEQGRLITVDLTSLEDTVRCPICYGKIKDSRVSMVCGHRYCAQCIDHCLRLEVEGRSKEVRECPVCRTHMPSRRSARQDGQFDALMRALYGNVAEYEAQEERVLEVQCQAQAAKLAEDMKHMREAMERQREARVAARSGCSSRAKRPRDAEEGKAEGSSSPQRHVRAKTEEKAEASGQELHPGGQGAKGRAVQGTTGAKGPAVSAGHGQSKSQGAKGPAVAAGQPRSRSQGEGHKAATAGCPSRASAAPDAHPRAGKAGVRGRAAAAATAATKLRGRAAAAALPAAPPAVSRRVRSATAAAAAGRITRSERHAAPAGSR